LERTRSSDVPDVCNDDRALGDKVALVVVVLCSD
jgi:hypothetical protein